MRIPLSLIKPSPRPVRTSMDEAKLNELAQSIQEQGLIVPVKVRPLLKGCRAHGWGVLGEDIYGRLRDEICDCMSCHDLQEQVYAPEDEDTEPLTVVAHPAFEIVYGHRRIEAARRAGLQEVEAIVEGVDDTAALVQALIENLQREDMAAIDKARALRLLMDEKGWNQTDVARAGIISQDAVSLLLPLLDETPAIQRLVSGSSNDSVVSYHHVAQARRAGLDDADREAVLRKVASEGLNVGQARQVAESVAAAPSTESKHRLLEWEYSPTIHDPELIRGRAKDYGGNDPMYRESGPSQQQRHWQETPEVAGLIQALKSFTAVLEQVTSMMQLGKLAPEARRFLANRYRQVAKQLNSKAEELEKDGN